MDAVRRELAVDPRRRLKLVANLPYHVGTPIITNLIASDLPWELMVVTIQYELAERMLAKPRTSEYSADRLSSVAMPFEDDSEAWPKRLLAAADR